jgi:EXLDI family protein
MMPTKTIYVADSDLPLFERAQTLAGNNLSAAIAHALRRYVEVAGAGEQGYTEITVRVGDKGTYTMKRFLGRPLAHRRVREAGSSRVIRYRVFQTAKGKLVLYTKISPDWNDPSQWWSAGNWDVDVDVDVDVGSSGGHEPWTTMRDFLSASLQQGGRWSGWSEGSEYRLQVFDTPEELRQHVPSELYEAVLHALRGPEIEDLDI